MTLEEFQALLVKAVLRYRELLGRAKKHRGYMERYETQMAVCESLIDALQLALVTEESRSEELSNDAWDWLRMSKEKS